MAQDKLQEGEKAVEKLAKITKEEIKKEEPKHNFRQKAHKP